MKQFMIVALFAVFSWQTRAELDPGRQGFSCRANADGVALQAVWADFFFKNSAADISFHNKTLHLNWGTGADPGEGASGNAEFNHMASWADKVAFFSAKRLSDGSRVNAFVIPSSVRKVDEKTHTAKFQVKVDLDFYSEGLSASESVLDCEGRF